MSNVYRLKEIARILGAEPAELKTAVAACAELAHVDPRLLDGKRFDEAEFAALAAHLRRRRAESAAFAAPAAAEVAPAAAPDPVGPALEALKGDLSRAIYAGDRRFEAILADLRRAVRRAEETGETGLRDTLGRIVLHFEEVCAKLNRQGRVLEETLATVRETANAVKRLENLETARAEVRARVAANAAAARETAAPAKGEPLPWHERLLCEMFTPWKLRGRV